MSALKDFEAAVGRESSALLSGWTPKDMASFSRNMEALFGLSIDDASSSLRVAAPREGLIGPLVAGLGEILDSAQCLRNIAIYVRRAPKANSGIEKGAYLRYHVENYLGELYILEKRLEAYLKTISRLFRLDPRQKELTDLAKSVRRVFKKSLSGADVARGVHVHQRRYTDLDLDRLRVLELVKDEGDSFGDMYDIAYRLARSRKRKWIERTNVVVDQLLDLYFAQLLTLLFDDEGHLKDPGSA